MNMRVIGNKGGKGSSKSSRTPVEDPNNLISTSTLRIVDVLSEGPVVGLKNGLRSVYLNNTPVQNADGSFNFKGVSIDFRNGYPDQEYIPGFPAAENEINVGVQVKAQLPVSSQISDSDANALLVKIRVQALTSVDIKTGDMHGTSVDLAFDIKTASGSFVQVGTMQINGKTTSGYERARRLELPPGGAPWTLRVRRLTADSESTYLSNDTYFSSYTIIYDAKLRYPDTALIAYKIDASQFGSQDVSRVVQMDGRITDVPVNYDPVARTYSGLWNGTFKKACHGNPAWVLWDLCVNDRFGLGDIIKASSIDKFGLYKIAQYCDELVPNGFGGMEPRYSFSGVINSATQAANVLDSIASAFRGMIYWGTNGIMFAQDAPGTPKKLVVPANVIDGEFNYSGAALKSSHTVVQVAWNDPDDLGRQTLEQVQDDKLIQRYGYRSTQIVSYGAPTRGQARRAGDWLLDTEANETEVVTYRAALDHADLRPGDLVAIADPAYAGGRFGGRMLATALDTITIDKGIEIVAGTSYSISVVMPDGSIQNRTITNAPGTDISVITLASNLPSVPLVGSLWVILGPVQPRLFRVFVNKEVNANIYEITATFHDPTKYARIERNVILQSPNYILTTTGPLLPPSGLNVKEFYKNIGSAASPALTASWSAPNDRRVSSYEYQIKGPLDAAWRASVLTSSLSFDDYPTDQGVYQFRVRSTALFNQPSEWATFQGLIFGPNQPIEDVTGFVIASIGPSSILSWDMLLSTVLDHYEIRFNRALSGATWGNSDVLVGGIPKTATSVTVASRAGTYLIKAVTYANVYSSNPALITSEIGGALNVNVVAELDEHPTFPGTRDGTQVISSNLRLDNLAVFMSSWTTLASVAPIGGGYVSEGYYYFDNSVDLGAVGQANVDVSYIYGAISTLNVISLWTTLAAVNPIGQISDEISVTPEVRTSNDNIVWSDWEKLTLGAYIFRSIEFRVHLESTNSNVTPSISELSAIVDMEDRIANDYNVSCPALGLRIDFDPPFMAPPSVHIDGQGLATGDYHAVTSRDETGFNVRFFNSAGTGKLVTFDWIAKGYGYKQ